MKKELHLITVAAAMAAALAFAACSNDDNGTGPGVDKTPPTVSSVGALDEHHVNVKFSEDVNRAQAETESNYAIDATGGGGGSVAIGNASLDNDGRTVMLTTTDSLTTAGYQVTVSNIEDMHGNAVESATTKEFAGSSRSDQTPPEIVLRAPGADATSVSTTDSIMVEFSEPLAENSFTTAFTMMSNGTPVLVTVTSADNVHFTVKPTASLNTGKLYTITLTGVEDPFGNVMTNTTWSFHTSATGSGGNAAPRLVGSTPANHATNVGLSSNIVLTFSEPIDTTALVVSFTPVLGTNVIPVWSNGNRTATFTPPGGLTAYQLYTMAILPGGLKSTAGATNQEAIMLTFTTGAALELGSISGTVTGPATGLAHHPSGYR